MKKRILFLEQYKVEASAILARQQLELNSTVPRIEYEDVTRELTSLREDLLSALDREVDARKAALSIQDNVILT